MDTYILANRFDLVVLNIWAKIRKVDLQLVPDDEAPIGLVIRKGMYSLSKRPTQTFILRTNKEGYKKLKPFVFDL